MSRNGHHHIRRHINPTIYFRANPNRLFRTVQVLYHSSSVDTYKEPLPSEWYKEKLPVLTKLTHSLKDYDLVDGKLEDINSVIIYNDRIKRKMQAFKSLARLFIGSPSIQQKLGEQGSFKFNESEREPFVVNSLTKVCNSLDISAQQRKLVRSTVCSQVTQYRIWRGALEELLNKLKEEVDWLIEHGGEEKRTRQGNKLGQQVILSCLRFLSDSSVSYEAECSTTWMKPVPGGYAKANASAKWEDVLDMVNDLRRYLQHNNEESDVLYHLEKLLSMKEGLLQIKDVFLDNKIGFREVRHQEHLVFRKLSKLLGCPSPCLFTLLMYFLYDRVRDIEVDLCGGFCKEKLCLSMGRILTSTDERMVERGIKQLDRGLGLFEFVWETAGMKEKLELQGHLWCLGVEERSIVHRGKTYFLHDLSL